MTRATSLLPVLLASLVAACVGSFAHDEPAPGDPLSPRDGLVAGGFGDTGPSDPVGPPGTQPVLASRPHAAGSGDGYLAVWVDERHGSTEVYGTRIAASGEVLDPRGIPISVGDGDRRSPRVAFDGERYLVVWTRAAGDSAAVHAARVDLDGTVLDRSPIHVTDAGAFTGSPDVASTGDGFLVVWEGPCQVADCAHGVSGAMVSADGIAGPAARIAAPETVSLSPAVSRLGSGYYVVWVDARNDSYDLYGRRVTAAGVPTGADIAVSVAIDEQIAPAIAGTAGEAMVVWQDSRYGEPRTYGARIFWTGAVMDPAGIEIATRSRAGDFPAVAAFEAGYGIAWTETREASGSVLIHTRLLAGSLQPLSEVATLEVPIAGRAGDDKHPVLAAADDAFALVWQGDWKTATTVYGCRLDQENRHMDEPAILATR